MLAVALPRGDRADDPIGRKQVGAGFVFGGLLFLLGHGSLAWAQQTVPAGVAALLVGSIPIWMALLDRIAFGRRLHASAYVGFALGFVGLAFLFDPFGEGSVDRLGALVIVLSALCWAAGSLYSRGAPLPKRPLVSAGLASLCGGVLLLVTAIAIGELGDVRFSLDALLALGYLVVIGTFVGFTAYVWLLRVAPISLVATYAYVNPIVAVFLGWALLGEEITVQMAVAGSHGRDRRGADRACERDRARARARGSAAWRGAHARAGTGALTPESWGQASAEPRFEVGACRTGPLENLEERGQAEA